jgi:hypothetical protein
MRFAVIVVASPVPVNTSVEIEATGRLPVAINFDEQMRDRIGAEFAVRAAVADAATREHRPLTVTDLATRLLSGEFTMTRDEWEQIKGDAKLRASWDFLNRSQALGVLPSVAAAASPGGLTAREFENGRGAIMSSSRPGFHFVKLVWEPRPAPRSIILQHDDGPPFVRKLPEIRASGDYLLICDEQVPADRLFLRWLADPRTIGWFRA